VTQAGQIPDQEGGMGLLGRAKVGLDAQMDHGRPGREPTAAALGQWLRLGLAGESEDPRIERFRLILASGRHGQLYVIEPDHLESHDRRPPLPWCLTWHGVQGTASLPHDMGSLIKKRRKRMRKKKHKKMLKATRWQRRAGK
jgi:mRNA-processing protein COX24